MKTRATLVHDHNALRPNFRLSVWVDGENIRAPECLNDIGLRYALIMEHDFCEANVNLICARAARQGRCRARFHGEKEIFIIERVMDS